MGLKEAASAGRFPPPRPGAGTTPIQQTGEVRPVLGSRAQSGARYARRRETHTHARARYARKRVVPAPALFVTPDGAQRRSGVQSSRTFPGCEAVLGPGSGAGTTVSTTSSSRPGAVRYRNGSPGRTSAERRSRRPCLTRPPSFPPGRRPSAAISPPPAMPPMPQGAPAMPRAPRGRPDTRCWSGPISSSGCAASACHGSAPPGTRPGSRSPDWNRPGMLRLPADRPISCSRSSASRPRSPGL